MLRTAGDYGALVEWHWQRKTEWLEDKLVQYDSAHHKHDIDRARIESRTPKLEAGK